MARRPVRTVVAEVDGGVAELVPDPDRARAWTLTVDGAPQSHVDLDDATRVDFEYVRWLGHVVVTVADPGVPIDVLHLGGGAWTLARLVAATRPRSRQRVVEVDGLLVEFVREHLPAGPRAGIRVRVGDAREVLAGTRPDSVDLLVLDAFSGTSIPQHLTTQEFARLAADVVRPGGICAVNLADGAPLRFARALAATFGAGFDARALIATPAVLRGRRFGNLLLLGSATALSVDQLSRMLAGEAFPARILDDDEYREFIAGAAVITDATASASPAPPPGWLTDLAGPLTSEPFPPAATRRTDVRKLLLRRACQKWSATSWTFRSAGVTMWRAGPVTGSAHQRHRSHR